MSQNLPETSYDLTKKSKLKNFYDKYKILIWSIILILIISILTISFYFKNQEDKKITLSNNYMKAKIYLNNGDSNKAKNILEQLIFANDSTYSTLSLFLILDENLILEKQELSNLFNHILENNKFDKELKNLIIFKKTLFQSNFVNETELLNSAKPLINTETLWKPHTLLLLGDYFVSKKEYSKAKDFYTQILLLKNIHKEFFNHAQSQLAIINNE